LGSKSRHLECGSRCKQASFCLVLD
jgi:hypothetical protein